MTREDDIRWLAERISPDKTGWCWHGCPKRPVPLDRPEYTLRLRESASRRPWWTEQMPAWAVSYHGMIYRSEHPWWTWEQAVDAGMHSYQPHGCAAAVYALILSAEREWAKKEATDDLAHD